jgi:ribosomal protein L34E
MPKGDEANPICAVCEADLKGLDDKKVLHPMTQAATELKNSGKPYGSCIICADCLEGFYKSKVGKLDYKISERSCPICSAKGLISDEICQIDKVSFSKLRNMEQVLLLRQFHCKCG